MSYVQVYRRRVPPEADSVRVSIQHQGNKLKHRPLIMGVYIGRAVAEKLGWNVRCRVNLFWGTDKHAGMARVERAERGSFVLQIRTRSTTGSSLFFKTAQLPPHVSQAELMYATEASHIILNNGLEITLPESLQPCTTPFPTPSPRNCLSPLPRNSPRRSSKNARKPSENGAFLLGGGENKAL